MRIIFQTKILFVVALAFLVVACGKKKSDLIVNKWKVSELELAGAKLTGDQVNIQYEFEKDGKFSRTESGKTENGTWELNADGNKLSLNIAETNQKIEKTVEELTAEKLVVSGEEFSLKSKLTLVPAAK